MSARDFDCTRWNRIGRVIVGFGWIGGSWQGENWGKVSASRRMRIGFIRMG